MKKILIIFLLIFIPSAAFSKDINVNCDCGIYHIVLKGERIKKKIKFVQNDTLVTNKEIHQKYKSKLTINTGFFDPKNQKTISYIVTDGVLTANPEENPALMNSKELKPHLDKILNRSELRVIKCKRKYYYDIAQHNDPIANECKIITSAQGGPQILPELNMEEEFFLLKKNGKIIRQSASVLFKTARTVAGLKDGNLHILIIPNENKMSMRDVWSLCKKHGFEKAMAFDGGSSTSFNYKYINLTSTDNENGRKLKSFMIVK